MSTRKVKDAKDTTTNEVIYFRGHAKATYMSDGRSVEDVINSIGSGGGEGGITQETDPVFMASAAAGIKSSDIAAWNNKSDFSGNYNDLDNKPTIPSAVTEDTVTNWGFTKNKGTVTGVKINGVTKSPNTNGVVDLGTIESGGDTTVINGVTDVTVDGVTVVSDNVAEIPLASTSSVGVVQLSNAVDSDSETKAATPKAVKEAYDLANSKQDTIDDLATIREKASAAFTGSINGTKDGGFFTVEKIVMNGTDYPREGSFTHIDLGTVLTEHQDISGKLDISEAASTYATKLALSEGLANKANKADIPDAVTEDTVRDWGFTKNTGNYSKPTGGIPFDDLDSNVQTILGKANMAIDRIVMNGVDYTPSGSETGIDLETVITEVSANNAVLTPEQGKVNIPAASTNKYGVTTLLTSTSSSSENKAATPKAVKAAYDHADSKQDALVSGTNIKTINGNSILGSGNIVVNAYPLVYHGTSDTTFELTPNVFHVWDNVASLSLTLGSGTEGIANEYLFQFSCLGGQTTTLGLPAGIQWANGEVPTLEVMKTYQVSILNNCATIQSFG